MVEEVEGEVEMILKISLMLAEQKVVVMVVLIIDVVEMNVVVEEVKRKVVKNIIVITFCFWSIF